MFMVTVCENFKQTNWQTKRIVMHINIFLHNIANQCDLQDNRQKVNRWHEAVWSKLLD